MQDSVLGHGAYLDLPRDINQTYFSQLSKAAVTLSFALTSLNFSASTFVERAP